MDNTKNMTVSPALLPPRPLPVQKRIRRWAGLMVLAALAVYCAIVWQHATLSAPAPTPILTDRHGTYLTQVGHVHEEEGKRFVEYGYWPVDPIPDRVARATLGLEDKRFWSHPGVDPLALGRAVVQNLSTGKRVSGASTIAMQVARMQNPRPRTFWAKIMEAGTAIALCYDRQEILAHYLRLVPLHLHCICMYICLYLSHADIWI